LKATIKSYVTDMELRKGSKTRYPPVPLIFVVAKNFWAKNAVFGGNSVNFFR